MAVKPGGHSSARDASPARRRPPTDSIERVSFERHYNPPLEVGVICSGNVDRDPSGAVHWQVYKIEEHLFLDILLRVDGHYSRKVLRLPSSNADYRKVIEKAEAALKDRR